jgi:hypothetical protein
MEQRLRLHKLASFRNAFGASSKCAPVVPEFVTRLLKHCGGTLEFKGPWFTNMDFVITGDPANIHHILVETFSNYHKGPKFREVFEPFVDGIITTDSDFWRYRRKLIQSMIKNKKYELLLEKVSLGKVETGLIRILNHVSSTGIEVDLQDVFLALHLR